LIDLSTKQDLLSTKNQPTINEKKYVLKNKTEVLATLLFNPGLPTTIRLKKV